MSQSAPRLVDGVRNGQGPLTFAIWASLLVGVIILVVLMPGDSRAGDSARFVDGQLGLGGGATYQFDKTRTAVLAAVNWTWDRDRYEIVAFRFATGQISHAVEIVDPNWIFEISRRWTLISVAKGKFFIGFGAAYKTKVDELNGSNLNFAEQIGWRYARSNARSGFEIAIRHVSNAGIKKPNNGQDFFDLAYLF